MGPKDVNVSGLMLSCYMIREAEGLFAYIDARNARANLASPTRHVEHGNYAICYGGELGKGIENGGRNKRGIVYKWRVNETWWTN